MTTSLAETADFVRAVRLDGISVSPIARLTALIAQMRRRGLNVIALNAGEPDFDTPEHVKEAAMRAMRGGQTKYTALDGTPELKSAIQHKFKHENGIDFSLGEITVAAGAKMIAFNALLATLNPGDEVVIPIPFWVTYADIVAIAAGRAVFVPCAQDNGFRLEAEDLERAITPRTRWLILNSPSNPSGAAYSEEDYRPILDVVERHPHVWLLSDDIYEHITYDDFTFVTPVQIRPEFRRRTLTVNGVSKAYAMTGWRLGYAAGPAALIEAMSIVQSQSTSCPSSIAQAAAVQALTGPQDILRERRRLFQQRRDLVVSMLNAIDGLFCARPEGAFYVFVDWSGWRGATTRTGARLNSDADFCDYLLREHGVAVVPGSAFGMSPYFRLSYASSPTELTEAVDRIRSACAALS